MVSRADLERSVPGIVLEQRSDFAFQFFVG